MSQSLAEQVKAQFADQVLAIHRQLPAPKGQPEQWVAEIRREAALPVLRFCHEKLRLTYLADVTAIDYLLMPGQHPERFAVIYVLRELKPDSAPMLVIKAWLPESDPTIESATPIWKAANWLEREVYDMFGITFRNHPNLIRILTPENFEGHPLRKDFPAAGIGYRDRFHVITRDEA